MKVPKYNRQVGETVDTGSRNLTAQISPSNMAAPFQATAQLGSDIAKAGLQWYGHDLKLKRNNEEAAAVLELRKKSSALKNKIFYGDLQKGIAPVSPEKQKETYDVEIKKIQANIAIKMSDKVAMKRFGSSSLETILTDSLDVQKNSRLQTVDRAKALFNEEIFTLKRTLQQNQSNPKGIEYKQAYEKLYGSIAYQKLYGVSSGNEIPSMFERGQILGVIDATDAQKLRRTSLEDLDESSINDKLRIANSREEFDNLEKQITSNKIYKNLEIGTQNRILNRLYKKRDVVIKRNNAAEAKEIRLNKLRTTETHRKTFTNYKTRILQWEQSQTFTWPGNDEITELEIIELLSDDLISSNQADALTKLLTDDNADQTDMNFYKDLKDRIFSNDVTNEELDEINNEIWRNTGRRGKITNAFADKLSGFIDRKRGNTKNDREEEAAREDVSIFLDNNLPQKSQTLFMFNNQLSNRFEDLLETENPTTKQKYTPEEAKKLVIDQAKNIILEKAIPIPPEIQSPTFQKILQNKTLFGITLEDVKAELKEAYLNTDGLKNDRMQIRIDKLNEMLQYFEKREAISKKNTEIKTKTIRERLIDLLKKDD